MRQHLFFADVAPGEEITCNYAEFEPGFYMLPSMVSAHAAAAPMQAKASGSGAHL